MKNITYFSGKVIEMLIEKKTEFSNIEYYQKHLELVRVIYGYDIQDREIDLISAFLSLDKRLTARDEFNTNAKKEVRKILKLSDSSMSNLIKSLVNKGFIIKDSLSGLLNIVDKLRPSDIATGYKVMIIKSNKNSDKDASNTD